MFVIFCCIEGTLFHYWALRCVLYIYRSIATYTTRGDDVINLLVESHQPFSSRRLLYYAATFSTASLSVHGWDICVCFVFVYLILNYTGCPILSCYLM